MRTLLALVGVFIAGTLIDVWPDLGSCPDKAHKESYAQSNNYNTKLDEFENLNKSIVPAMRAEMNGLSIAKKWITNSEQRKPSFRLPEVKPDLKNFVTPSSELKVIWFGHSTFLLNMNGTIILVDPVFTVSASPSDLVVRRFQAPALKLEELPPVDIILISHDHYDHLDRKSIKHFKDKNITFITPLGVGSLLQGWGVKTIQIIERDWWQSQVIQGITFTATPAQHFSGRDGINNNKTLWASWVVSSDKRSIYFSGDSGYSSHFKTIGDRLGPFDIAFMESGQYNLDWKAVHLMPEEAIEAFAELRANYYFPIHWGMFVLSLHSWDEPIVKLHQHFNEGIDKPRALLAPKLGQIIDIEKDNSKHTLELWWQ